MGPGHKQFQPAFLDDLAVVGGQGQMVGDTQDQVQLLPVQEPVQHAGGVLYRADLIMGMPGQELLVELGENGVPAHGNHPDPQDLPAGFQGSPQFFQLFAFFQPALAAFPQLPALRGERNGAVLPFKQSHAAVP